MRPQLGTPETQQKYNIGGGSKSFNDAKNLSLQKTVELRIETISQNKDKNFSTLEALKNDYLNEEKKNHRAKTVKDLKLRLNRFLDCFKRRTIPRDSETLFKRFYDFHLINMTSSFQ